MVWWWGGRRFEGGRSLLPTLGSQPGPSNPRSVLGGEAQAPGNGRGAAGPMSTRADAGGAFVLLGRLAAGAGALFIIQLHSLRAPFHLLLQEE